MLPSDLPPHLEERSRVAAPRSLRAGAFVLYWMRVAARGHENPALDVAIHAASALDVPVLVYHGLSEKYPYASDRHHSFILEGARDVSDELRRRGIGYAFHLERPGHRGPHLKELARRARLVVTEDMPVPPLSGWTDALAESVDTPVWLVDTACVVPMRSVASAPTRAYRYRAETDALRRERLVHAWEEVTPHHAPALPELPFDPIDLSEARIPALVAACAIDHTVAAVPHTRGGAAAGYARWQRFVQNSLRRYDRDRNDPLRNGVSRMSAYLHYGHVSPFRLAREAAAIAGRGADKFLDELLVWRELAYTFCFHTPDVSTIDALPEWARDTLKQHASDPRPALYDWERLARGRTDDALWNAAQASLRIHGELHNNVRMTWGKALLSWTQSPEQALALLLDLNHRYALDGRDPASYGGILWCLGLFDRPFEPERRIVGSVRGRSTVEHARRLDVPTYAEKSQRSPFFWPPRVAVIGAGLSGLTCARTLQDHGIDVEVFERGTKVGGRTRSLGLAEVRLDAGAQYFTARGPLLKRYVRAWVEQGLVAEWRPRVVRIRADREIDAAKSSARYVGVPTMDALCEHLARDLEVHTRCDVRSIARASERLEVSDEERVLGAFDRVVVAAPPPAAAQLLQSIAPDLASTVRRVEAAPCWAALLRFETPIASKFDAAFVESGPLRWVARDSSKPSRASAETWVLHASPDFTIENLETPPKQVLRELRHAFAELARDLCPPEPVAQTAVLWPAALPEPLDAPFLLDVELGVGACGDWCGGPRVEGAFESGAAIAGHLLGTVAPAPGR